MFGNEYRDIGHDLKKVISWPMNIRGSNSLPDTGVPRASTPREVSSMKTWGQLTAEYRRLIEERDNLLSRMQGEPTPAEQGRLEVIADSILNLLQEPVDGPRDEP